MGYPHRRVFEVRWVSVDGAGRLEQTYSFGSALGAAHKAHVANMGHGDRWGHRYRVTDAYGTELASADEVWCGSCWCVPCSARHPARVERLLSNLSAAFLATVAR